MKNELSFVLISFSLFLFFFSQPHCNNNNNKTIYSFFLFYITLIDRVCMCNASRPTSMKKERARLSYITKTECVNDMFLCIYKYKCIHTHHSSAANSLNTYLTLHSQWAFKLTRYIYRFRFFTHQKELFSCVNQLRGKERKNSFLWISH